MLIQVKYEDLYHNVKGQAHEQLAILLGVFMGHAERWSIFEKEAFAVLM